MRKYLWRKRTGWSRSIGLTKLMAVAGIKVATGTGPFSITEDGQVFASGLSRIKTLRRLKRRLSEGEVGPVFRVRRKAGDVVFVTRGVRVELLPTDSTNGNARADAFYNWVVSNFKAYAPRYAGAYVCKQIADSSTLSQHSYGNAVDFFFDTLDHQHAVALKVLQDATTLRPYHVISKNQVWTKGVGWHSYGGEYHRHLHVDFDPQQSGSCGVKVG